MIKIWCEFCRMEVNSWPEHRASKLHHDNLKDPEENPMGYGLIMPQRRNGKERLNILREDKMSKQDERTTKKSEYRKPPDEEPPEPPPPMGFCNSDERDELLLTEIKDAYCKWCPREQECDENLTLEEKRGCVACGGFADEFVAKVKQHYEQEGLKVLAADGEWYEASDEFKETVRSIDAGLKRLDRPELKENFLIDLRLLEERKTSPEWVATKYLALIPDTEELKNEWTFELGKVAREATNEAVEEAKKQERERIGEFIDHNQLVQGKKHISWWEVAERLKSGQALKEEKEEV